MTAVSDDSLVGRVLDDRYRLEARIGGGGMGDVYRGHHLMMAQRVAVKVLKPDLTADPTAAKRFVREARSTFRLDHPGCVRVTDMGATDDGLMYLVMEYLDGRTVGQELLHDGPLAAARVAHIAQQVCAALQCAHDLGIVHRDLKPDNLMLVQRGRDFDVVKVLDFGLAKFLAEPGGAFTAFSLTPLTREGMVFGTPAYMSPEQAVDDPLTPASDLYSLGVVMYEMLTGEIPFESANYMEILAAHVQEQAIAPSERCPDLAIPAALSGLVMDLLAKEPEARPPSAEALARELQALSLPTTPSAVSSELAASATLDLREDEVARAASETLAPVARAQAPAHPPTAPEDTSTLLVRARGRRRTGWLLGFVAVVTAVAAVLVWTLRTDAPASETPPSARERSSEPSSRTPSEPPPATPSAVAPMTRDAGPADAGAVPAQAEPPSRSRSKRPRKSTSAPSPDVARHLEQAVRAQRAGNVLEQMAHADSALRLAPRNRRAAYLLGDALRASDPARACRYLKRARRLAEARKAYAETGCDGID